MIFSLPLDSAIISGYDQINEDSIVLHWEFWQVGILVTYDLGIIPSTIGDNLIMLEFVCENKNTYSTYIYKVYGVFTYGLTSKQSFEVLSFKIYPNPAKDFLVVETDNNLSNIKLIDVMGKILLNQSFTKTTRIETKSFKDGVYFLKIENGKNVVIKKIIITK